MEITLQEHNGIPIAIITSDTLIFTNEDEAAELLMNCYYQGAEALIVMAENLPPEFFDLKTKLAGEVLQKFSTYNTRLAVIGDFSKFDSKSLQDFIRESNRIGRILFVPRVAEARAALAKAAK